MNNYSALLRSFIVFGVCVVLAVWLGFLLAGPLTYSSMVIYGVLGLLLVSPVFLQWHYPLMLLGWNMVVVVLFMPGRPLVCLPLIALSLGISILRRMINRETKFISAPPVTV